MSMQFSEITAQSLADGLIGPDEVLALRRSGWADGQMDPEEAESLFVANDRTAAPTREWIDFFVEALGTFVVHTVEPRGYVDQAMADELIARIDRDGRVGSLAELELLVKVLETATSAPANLKAYALKQLEDSVMSGEGPARGATGEARGVTADEAAMLRRLIFAPASDRPAAVSKAEAEMLFRIKDATLYEVNDPAWARLFVQGVANYLLGFETPEPLSRGRAAELEAFMASEGGGIGAFLARMFRGDGGDGAGAAFGSLLDLTPHAAAGGADHAEPGDVDELWLLDRIDADEELDEMEKALLAFIAEETGTVFGLPADRG